jgi:hypothetical protein
MNGDAYSKYLAGNERKWVVDAVKSNIYRNQRGYVYFNARFEIQKLQA